MPFLHVGASHIQCLCCCCQDNFYGTVDAKSDVKERWFGLATLGLAANNVAVAEGNGLGARDVRKNTLLATGAVFGAAALMEGYNIR